MPTCNMRNETPGRHVDPWWPRFSNATSSGPHAVPGDTHMFRAKIKIVYPPNCLQISSPLLCEYRLWKSLVFTIHGIHLECWMIWLQSTLPYVVGHVSQFPLSQSYGRDRLPESAQFDSFTTSCAADSGHGLFFSFFSLLKGKTILANRRIKNPPRVKLDQPQWRKWPCWRRFMQGWAVAFLLQLFPDQSINQSIINWKMLEILPTVFTWRENRFDVTYFEVVIWEFTCGE